MKYFITTDGNDQGWMDAFNNFNKSSYKLNQEIKAKYADEVKQEIENFNGGYALGPAIKLEEVE